MKWKSACFAARAGYRHRHRVHQDACQACPGSALEVLLYAIARHMIVGHESAVENFISVASIALIFFVRKFLFVPAFGATMPGGRKAPDIEEMEKQDTAGESEK